MQSEVLLLLLLHHLTSYGSSYTGSSVQQCKPLVFQEFQVYYQPITCLKLGTLSGFEALARWNHPTKGRIGPDHFIPICEETGF